MLAMNVNTLIRQMEKRRSQIAWAIDRLKAEERRLLDQKDAIEREAFINLQID